MTINPLTKVNKSKVCMISMKSFHGGTTWTEPGTIHFKREKWNGEAREGETSCVTLPDCTVDYRFVYTVNRWHTCMHSHKHNHTHNHSQSHTHMTGLLTIYTQLSHGITGQQLQLSPNHTGCCTSQQKWLVETTTYNTGYSQPCLISVSSQLSVECSGGALLTGQNMKNTITEFLSQSSDLTNICCIVTSMQQTYSSWVLLIIRSRSYNPLYLQSNVPYTLS